MLFDLSPVILFDLSPVILFDLSHALYSLISHLLYTYLSPVMLFDLSPAILQVLYYLSPVLLWVLFHLSPAILWVLQQALLHLCDLAVNIFPQDQLNRVSEIRSRRQESIQVRTLPGEQRAGLHGLISYLGNRVARGYLGHRLPSQQSNYGLPGAEVTYTTAQRLPRQQSRDYLGNRTEIT